MKANSMETLYVLNHSDHDRIDAALGLLRQILEDLMKARRVRVPKAPLTPGALYELEQDATRLVEQLEMEWPEDNTF